MASTAYSKAHICVVAPYSPIGKGFGGIARSTGAYLAAFSTADIAVDLVCSLASDGPRHGAPEIEAAFKGLRAHVYRPNLSSRWAIGLGFLFHVVTLIRANTILIHGILSLPTIVAAIICRIMNKRFYIVGHATLDTSRNGSLMNKRPLIYGITRPIIIWAARGASAILVSGDLEIRYLPVELRMVQSIVIENFFSFNIEAICQAIASPSRSGSVASITSSAFLALFFISSITCSLPGEIS